MNLIFDTNGNTARKPLPQVINSTDAVVAELDPQTPLVQPGDFVMGVIVGPYEECSYIVEVWGPAEMIAQEQSFRTRWWAHAFMLGIALTVVTFAAGYWWALR